jgi:hypothetical protein
MLGRAGSAVHEHGRWTRGNQWRHAEVDRIDRQHADHWAATILTAVNQDDPLAYGLDRLRNARTILATRDGDLAERDLAAVTEALGRERVVRLRAVADGAPPPEHLTSSLGPIPNAPAARDTWLGLALHIERRLDAGLDLARPADGRASPSIAERLDRLGRSDDPLDNARAIIDTAERDRSPMNPDVPSGPQRWLDALEQSAAAHRALERQRTRELDRDLGISL